MISVRSYRESDWEMVKKWWDLSGEIAPVPGMMPLDSSFIAEIDGKPALAGAVYLTNTPEIAYAENLVGNPDLKGEERRAASRRLSDHAAEFARSLGYQRLICMTEKESLMHRYQELGFRPTLSGVTTFVRDL